MICFRSRKTPFSLRKSRSGCGSSALRNRPICCPTSTWSHSSRRPWQCRINCWNFDTKWAANWPSRQRMSAPLPGTHFLLSFSVLLCPFLRFIFVCFVVACGGLDVFLLECCRLVALLSSSCIYLFFSYFFLFSFPIAIWTVARHSWATLLSPSQIASASSWPRRSSRTKLSFLVSAALTVSVHFFSFVSHLLYSKCIFSKQIVLKAGSFTFIFVFSGWFLLTCNLFPRIC